MSIGTMGIELHELKKKKKKKKKKKTKKNNIDKMWKLLLALL